MTRNIPASLEELGIYKRDTFPKIILAYEVNILVQALLTCYFGSYFSSMKECVRVGGSDPRIKEEKQERLKSQRWLLLLEMADLKLF